MHAPPRRQTDATCIPPTTGMSPSTSTARRLLVLADGRGWSFDRIAHQLARYAGSCRDVTEVHVDYYPEVLACASVPPRPARPGYTLPAWIPATSHWDAVACLWYGQAVDVFAQFPPQTRRIVCVYDCLHWMRSAPARRQLTDAIRAAHVVLVASDPVRRCLWDEGILSVETLAIVETAADGVDLDHFVPLCAVNDDGGGGPDDPSRPLRIGWAGYAQVCGDDSKGLDLIREAVRLAGGWLVLHAQDASDVQNGPPRPHHDMPSFYHGIDVYVCMSVSEGTPNPILESAACGVPFVSTLVGVVPRLMSQSVAAGCPFPPGMVVPQRTATALLGCLASLRDSVRRRAMGCAARTLLETCGWSWSIRAPEWICCAMRDDAKVGSSS